MSTWFTSDLHFGHKNVIPYCERPWAYVDEMNEGLIQNWNATVSSEDTVIVLGDFSFLNSTKTNAIFKRLRGIKILVRGNHDRKYSTVWGGAVVERHYYITMNTEDSTITLFGEAIDGLAQPVKSMRSLVMSHYPYEDERFPDRAPEDKGLPLLCGHVHKSWHKKGRMFNVGVDVNGYKPVHSSVINEWVKTL